MSERYAEPGCVFFYYVTAGGDVHFGLNNEEKGIFFSGVDVSRPLWSLVDIYGNATALEIVRKFTQLSACPTSRYPDFSLSLSLSLAIASVYMVSSHRSTAT